MEAEVVGADDVRFDSAGSADDASG
jgi:hypothetical protein